MADKRINTISELRDDTPEGKLLLMALAKLGTINNNYKGTNKTPDEILGEINEVVTKVYYNEQSNG